MAETVEALVERIQRQDYHCLNISHRNLTILPTCLRTLRNLRVILLNGNDLVFPPEEVMHLCHSLEELVLDGNKFTLIPSGIGKFMKLKTLSLSGTPLGALNPEITKLGALRELWLNNCSLASLPASIGHLENLTKLGLKGNNLAHIPNNFGKLHNLKWLCFAENFLRELPREFGNLPALRYIDLRSDSFEAIPPPLLDIGALRVVLLSNNAIKTVSDDALLGLANMTKVDLRNNPMNEKPKHWKGMEFILVGDKSSMLEQT